MVCDDIPFEKFPAFKAFVGCQSQFTMTDRYRKKTTIKEWAKPCIICINEDMQYENHLNYEEKMWFRENVTKIILKNKLY